MRFPETMTTLAVWQLLLFLSPVGGFLSPQRNIYSPVGLYRRTLVDQNAVSEKRKSSEKVPVNGDANGKLDPRYKETLREDILNLNATTNDFESIAASAAEDLNLLMEEINSKVANGTATLLRDLTENVEERLIHVPQASTTEISTLLMDLSKQVQKAQQEELERQLAEIEKQFIKPFEDLAFSDVPLLESKRISTAARKNSTAPAGFLSSDELVLLGENSTLPETRRLRTKDILRNWNIAPFYYSIALLARWVRKASYPSMALISAYKSMANVVKSNSKGGQVIARKKRTGGGEDLQAGWKRTGEIAAKGSLGRKWAILRRSAEIWAYFSSFYIKDRRITARYNSGSWSEERFKAERSKLGKEITQNLLKLGPTFIKVGQLFSTRIDIVPQEYIDELKLLQDNVPAFSGDLAVKIIEEELGKPIDELFDEFDRESLAAASLGQVHVARIGNRKVAVKVQRQYLQELFEVDLGQLRQVAVFADALDLTSEGGVFDRNTQRDWVSVFEENKRLLYQEIDYIHEMNNCDKFRENFDKPKFRHIRAPQTYPELTTKKVMTMEFLPGIKVTDVQKLKEAGIEPMDISRKLSESFLEQLCRHGFVSTFNL